MVYTERNRKQRLIQRLEVPDSRISAVTSCLKVRRYGVQDATLQEEFIQGQTRPAYTWPFKPDAQQIQIGVLSNMATIMRDEEESVREWKLVVVP
jgi:hypothetical protein